MFGWLFGRGRSAVAPIVSNKRKLRVDEVFQDGGFDLPHTYVDRPEAVQLLRMALRQRNKIVLFHGPSKSGKTVLCNKLIDDLPKVSVQAFRGMTPEYFWTQLHARLRLPSSTQRTIGLNRQVSEKDTVSHEVATGLAKIRANQTLDVTEVQSDSITVSQSEPPMVAAINFLLRQPHTIFIDDFHFWRDQEAIVAVLQPLKEVLGKGSRIVLISVRNAAFSRIESMENMEGRFHEIRMPQWSKEDLEEIAIKGFDKLAVDLAPGTLTRLRRLCYLNPLLMQGLCLALCDNQGIEATLDDRKTLTLGDAEVEKIAGNYAALETNRFDRLLPPNEPRTWETRDGRRLTLSEVVILGINHVEPLKPYSVDTALKRLKDRVLKGPMPITVKASLVQRLQQFEARTGVDGDPPPILYDEHEQAVVLLDPYFKLWARWGKGPVLAGKLLDS